MAQTSPIPDHEILIRVFQSHPEWTLAQLGELAETNAGKQLLERVRVGDLWSALDPVRYAEQLHGAQFDIRVLAVIVEAGSPVAASYLRARVGGPRWKLQASFGRLVAAGKIERSGTTSSTRYWPARAREN